MHESIHANPLRLLVVTPRYHPYMGGVETHVYEIARRLAGVGIEVTVLTTDPGGQLPTTEESENVRIRRVRAWPAGQDFYFAPDIYKIITQGNWDVVHIQSYHTLVAPMAMFAAWRAKIPYVVTFHGGGHSSRLHNALRKLQYAMLRPLLARAGRLIAIAQFEIKFFGKQLKLPAEHFVLIPNGADLPKASHPILHAVTERH
jgi:glycosyltransferase involved in cell wall biosynthesis